jgi:glycosyltransferase involved in cell wall biosynthesis
MTRLRRLPLVAHFHGPWAEESADAGRRGRWAGRPRRAVERFVYRRADAVVVLSDAFADLVTTRYGVRRERVHVIRPGVDLDRFSPGRQAARQALGLAPDQQVVFSARRLFARMGLDVLVDAMPHLPGCTTVLAGTGPEADALCAHVRARGVEDRVVLLGGIDDDQLVTWYRAADVVVVPSRSFEGFGLITLEALACGVAVVVTDVGGLREAVRALDDALVVPPEQPVALAAAITRVLDGAGPSPSRCREHAEQYTWQRAADEHVALYAAVSGRRAATEPAA